MVPSRCPDEVCESPATTPFYRCKGTYVRRDGREVARFQCRTCGLHFSEQTFRADYRRRRAHLDTLVARLVARGTSLRATARLLGVNRKTVVRWSRRGHPSGAGRAASESNAIVAAAALAVGWPVTAGPGHRGDCRGPLARRARGVRGPGRPLRRPTRCTST